MTSHTTQADLEIMDAEEYSTFLAYGEPETNQELTAEDNLIVARFGSEINFPAIENDYLASVA